MSITIPNPQTKSLVQTNTSDALGSIYASQNLDIQENEGRIRLGKRMVINSDDTDSGLSDLYNPVAYASHNSKIYTLGGSTSSTGIVYKSGTTSLQSNFTADNTSNYPALIDSRYSDMIQASNGALYATGTTKLYECSGGNWSATTVTLASGGAHMLASYNRRLYVTNNANQVASVDIAIIPMVATLSTTGNPYFIKVGDDSDANTITFLRASASRIWIGTVNTRGGKGYVYEWDGVSNTPTRSYRLESSGALACVIKDEVPHIIDANGDLLAWNGGTFQKLAGFNRTNGFKLKNSTGSSNTRFIHPNGMSVVDGNIHILINNENDNYTTTIEDTIPSGVWEYTQANGLVHKYGIGSTKSSATITDYGQNRVFLTGAISELNRLSSDTAPTTNGSFLIGANIYTDGATAKKAVISYDDMNDTLQKAGSWVTPFLESTQLTDIFQKVIPKFKRFLASTDKIVVKTRSVDVDPVEATITWTSTTTFTVPNSSVVVSNYWTEGTGGEVEVTQGIIGSGKCAHITNAVNNAGTWTVTVDETFTGATSQTAKARFSNWNKLGTIQNQVLQYEDLSIPETDSNSIYIQAKLWILFTGKNEIHSLNIISKPNEKLL